jgi:uncharacterized protein YdeI (YjbR/CyaY-like superfamily)
MPVKTLGTLDVRTRREWRKWLREHHDAVAGIWLVFHKRHTGVGRLTYDDAVEEALCYGWIDSILKRLDDERYVRKFTPRKADSVWSTTNRRRYADLEARGLLAAPGRARAPTDRSGDAPRRVGPELPAYLERALKANPRAWEQFQQLAPSHRRNYVGWIDSAKRQETKERRLREALDILAVGGKLGLK